MTTGVTAQQGFARVAVQRFGTFLSNMVLPNIAAFIAWGLITAIFIKAGWINVLSPQPEDGWVAALGGWGAFDGKGIVGPTITYLLPILIGYTGGKIVYDVRGGVVGAIATMGVITGTTIPMFMGAMIMGPLGGWTMKKLDGLWEHKIKPGFEMLVNNFSAGIWGGILAIFAFFVMSPIVTAISNAAGAAVGWLINTGLLPLTSTAANITQEQAIAMAARNGRISFFGGLPKTNPTITCDSNLVHYRQLHIHGANGSAPSHNKQALEYIASGLVPVKDLITVRLPLERALEAFDIVAAGKAIKVTIEP